MTRAIAVMAKQPLPGRAKTRLTPMLSDADAAELSACMIVDTVGLLDRRTDCEVFIAADSPPSVAWFEANVSGHEIVVQQGDALGERLDSVMHELLGRGFTQVFAIGSDSPDLPTEHLDDAFALLDDDDVDLVFGPTDDGGYYLVGWKHRWRPVLTDVQMSTPTVLADSIAISDDLGARVALAPGWFDVDEIGDLDRLWSSIEGGGASRTRGLLSRLRTA